MKIRFSSRADAEQVTNDKRLIKTEIYLRLVAEAIFFMPLDLNLVLKLVLQTLPPFINYSLQVSMSSCNCVLNVISFGQIWF